jgi:hypothetical protein
VPRGRPNYVVDQRIERISTSAGPVLAGAVMGSALFRMSPRDVPALRRKPGPVREGYGRVPPSLLRNSDEQTIAGTAAVFTAMEAMGRSTDEFESWGVVAASRYLGRANLAVALRTFVAEGVWGTSPHLIPHFALHSASGTISLALGSHGPNLGVGGGLHTEAEGFLAALTWLAAGAVPGVWLVLSGWSPELVPDPRGGTTPIGECRALALALLAVGSSGEQPMFRIIVGEESRHAPAPLDLVGLADSLGERGGPSPRLIATDPRGRLRVELIEGADGPG